MKPLSATYRLQLRQGVDFDRAAELLAHIDTLGASHLYLSPIFTAPEDSTHGYDVADPSQIDPILGGRAGFERLARAAQARGIGIVLDLVPNHTVLSVENPWLLDALKHGAASAYADFFDVDWDEGLILPILSEPFDDMAAAGAFEINAAEERIEWQGGWLPLAPGTAGLDLPEMMRAQHWRLRFWERERRRLTHRRFFNVTTLIGMRIEEQKVFDAMMALPVALVRARLVQGLRIDHVDGLARPGEYLARLREAVGPKVPVWVEKILTGDEEMPQGWATDGTTGYEASDRITRLLMDESGQQRLDSFWREATGAHGSYEDMCVQTRGLMLDGDLRAELVEMQGRAQAALAERGDTPRDGEELRAAIRALLMVFPQYRSYVTPDGARDEDEALLRVTFERAGALVGDAATLAALRRLFDGSEGPQTYGFVRRFQQVTGAVVAKAQEDTAFFRYTRNLAECEVGSEPDAPLLSAEAFESWCRERQGRFPLAMTLGSSHDSKRGEDARARLVALSHDPLALRELWQGAAPLATAGAPRADVRWYILQSAVAMWEPGRDDLEARLGEHMEKALREARQLSSWTNPDEAIEAAAAEFGAALLSDWRRQPPEALSRLVQRGEALSLAAHALRLVMPGVPDIYQGSEYGSYALTDPDNRAVFAPHEPGSRFGHDKLALTRRLLGLRARAPGLFLHGSFEAREDRGGLLVTRRQGEQVLSLYVTLDGSSAPVLVEVNGIASLDPVWV
ncbi:malto-oligosyltrehalose synthase [Salipiger sp. 1_MG-2023]|uniref:malto-oligosyltrehalose synthase n=1 Tax=Salipiger sp. 1_MG-2023 TaxID=3062665 RepID=UPI0026E20BE9|nr:malto-oligosyltrehalose synthase [Salipiger sp. 1_MG-2023]MDO6585294.1 malto-oligosyltrehalose synthase [Salipiger sp. 1_MG-2023]